jgi:hypothetical protein
VRSPVTASDTGGFPRPPVAIPSRRRYRRDDKEHFSLPEAHAVHDRRRIRDCHGSRVAVLTYLRRPLWWTKKTEQFSELMKRPDIDQAVARYDEMYTKARGQLKAVVPALTWRQTGDCPGQVVDGSSRQSRRERDSLTCGTRPAELDGGRQHSRRAWEQAVSVVRGIAQGYGFDAGEVTVNRLSDHEIVFHDQ